MANKVNNIPNLPLPVQLQRFADVQFFLTQLINSLKSELSSHAYSINVALPGDGSGQATAPVLLSNYVKAALPSAATYIYGMIIVTDDVGGLTPAFSDGANWRRVADRNIIS